MSHHASGVGSGGGFGVAGLALERPRLSGGSGSSAAGSSTVDLEAAFAGNPRSPPPFGGLSGLVRSSSISDPLSRKSRSGTVLAPIIQAGAGSAFIPGYQAPTPPPLSGFRTKSPSPSSGFYENSAATQVITSSFAHQLQGRKPSHTAVRSYAESVLSSSPAALKKDTGSFQR